MKNQVLVSPSSGYIQNKECSSKYKPLVSGGWGYVHALRSNTTNVVLRAFAH